MIAQPKRTLPAQVKFEVPQDPQIVSQTYSDLYQMYNATGTINREKLTLQMKSMSTLGYVLAPHNISDV